MCILQKLIYGCSWSIIITVAPGTSFIIVRKRLSLHFEQTIKASWDVYRELIQKTHCCTAKLSSFITFSFFAFFCHCLDWAKNKNIMSALGKHGLAWRGHIMLIFWFILLFGAPCRIGLQTWIFKKKKHYLSYMLHCCRIPFDTVLNAPFKLRSETSCTTWCAWCSQSEAAQGGIKPSKVAWSKI